MRAHPSSLLNAALVASAVLHAALIGSASLRGQHRAPESDPVTADRWSASAIEVGTVAAAPTPARAPEPAEPPPVEEAKAENTVEEAKGENPVEEAQAEEPSAPRPARAPARPVESETAPRGAPAPLKAATTSNRASKTAPPTHSAAPSSSEAACTSGCERTAAPGASLSAQNLDPSAAVGELGETGLPPGVRHFATAFVRAVPAASYSDAAWSELPLGVVGEIIVEIRMDAEGRIEDVKLEPETPAPVLKRMTDRAILLLKSGTFSLDRKSVGAGIERLSLAVTLSEAANDPDEAANPRHLRALGYEAPTRSRAGYARFTLNSGREMRATVRRVDR